MGFDSHQVGAVLTSQSSGGGQDTRAELGRVSAAGFGHGDLRQLS